MRGGNTELAGGIVGRFLCFRREFVRCVLPTPKPPRGLNGQVVHAFGRKEDIGPRLEQAVDAIAGDIHLLLPDALLIQIHGGSVHQLRENDNT